MPATAPTARFKTRYLEEIRPALVDRFGYTSVMQAPKLQKITVNMGVGLAKQDSKVLKAALDQLATIAGQQPSVRRARKSIASFKLREGMPVGVAVTLRSERGYEFLDRLVSIAIPRIRDFRGLSPRSFDGRGNYSLGVKEQIIFPEIDYDAIDMVRGLDITITTSASTDIEAFALLQAFGMPFAAQGRPRGFDPEADAAAEAADEQEKAAAAAAEAEAPAEKPKAAAEPEPEESAEGPEAAVAAETEDAAEESGAAEASESEAESPEALEPEAEEPEAEAPEAEAQAPEPEDSTADEPQAAAEPATEDQSDPSDPGDTDTAEKESAD
jgi:large subunit ribosomal protein L5